MVGLNVKACCDSIGEVTLNFTFSSRHGPPKLSLEN